MDKKHILEQMRGDMLLFGRMIMPNMFSQESPRFHYDITKHLLDENKTNQYYCTRGHAKSSVVAGVFPLFHLMFDPGVKVVVLVSRTQSHATKLLGTIKDVLNYSQEFRYFFGYWGMQNARKWSNNEIELKDGSIVICKGTGQQIRGIKHGNQRPTLIVLDDPEDEVNTKTAEAMEFNLRWLLQSGVPSLDPIKGRIAVIGTPQHERCLVETLKSMEGWRNLEYRPDMEKEEALWEQVWPIEKLKQKKSELIIPMQYGLFSGGKKIRSKILNDVGLLFKINYDTLIMIGSAVECIHAYSLIHDDLPSMDNDNIRRGKDSNHIKYGEAIAILSGDALQTLAFEVITNDDDLDSDLKVSAISLFALYIP